MCLAIPGKIVDAEDLNGLRFGRVEFGGVNRQICLDLVPDAKPGDYVLVHAGIAITQVDEAEAARTLELMERTGLVAEELAPPEVSP